MSALPPKAEIDRRGVNVRFVPTTDITPIPARGSSAADLTTRYIPSHTPSLETDSVGKSRRAPTSARAGRRLKGYAQTINLGADIFLADTC
jgi:hypothetical protein